MPLFTLAWFIPLFSAIAFGAAAGNPLGGAMVNESLKHLQTQSSGGLGLTGNTYTPDPPKFSKDGNLIIYTESPKGDDQYAISRQKVFSTIGDTHFYSDGESVFEGTSGVKHAQGAHYSADDAATYESPQFVMPKTEDVRGLPDDNAGNTYSLKQDYQDTWAIGNGWLGAQMGYRALGSNQGNTFASAHARGTVLGQSTLILGANIHTARDYKGTAPVNDDTLKYAGNFYLMGQKTELTKGEIKLGFKKTYDELAHFDQNIFKQEWQYFIGPVPILVRARLNGKASTGKPVVEAGVVAGALNEITYNGQVQPYSSLKGAGDVVLGGFATIPDNLLPAYVKGVVESDFITGNILSRGYGSSAAKGACLEVGMGDFRTMKTSIWGEAKWDVISTEYVKTFVNAICDNGYFTIPGCSGVQAVLTQVQNIFTFKKRRDLYNHPGFNLGGNKKWLDIQGCKTALEPTVLELCNKSAEPIHSSILLFDAQNNFWKSVGWYQLPANGCRKVPLGNYQNGNVYVYSEYQGGLVTWTGNDASMCVHKTDRFDINKGNEAASCNGANFKMVKATKINAPKNQITTHSFGAADFAQYKKAILKLCNKTIHDNIYTSVTFFKKSWMSKGWFKVAKDGCFDVDLGATEGDVFIHGNPDSNFGATFGRGWNFCVHGTNAFEYPFVDTMGCSANGNVLKGFSVAKVKRGTNIYNFEKDQQLLMKRVCNNSDEKIWVTWGWDENYSAPDGRRLRGTQGWWALEKDKCMDGRLQSPNDIHYVHARGDVSGKTWPKAGNNNTKMCVNKTTAFELTHAPNPCPDGMVEVDFAKNPGTAMVSID